MVKKNSAFDIRYFHLDSIVNLQQIQNVKSVAVDPRATYLLLSDAINVYHDCMSLLQAFECKKQNHLNMHLERSKTK